MAKKEKKYIPIPTFGIAVDGGCSFGSHGDTSMGFSYYKGVDISTGITLFEKNIGLATNNIAEYLAIIHALARYGNKYPIYSDSTIAIGWVMKKNMKTKHRGTIIDRVLKAEDYLRSLDFAFDLRKWETKWWGENPADFGLK